MKINTRLCLGLFAAWALCVRLQISNTLSSYRISSQMEQKEGYSITISHGGRDLHDKALPLPSEQEEELILDYSDKLEEEDYDPEPSTDSLTLDVPTCPATAGPTTPNQPTVMTKRVHALRELLNACHSFSHGICAFIKYVQGGAAFRDGGWRMGEWGTGGLGDWGTGGLGDWGTGGLGDWGTGGLGDGGDGGLGDRGDGGLGDGGDGGLGDGGDGEWGDERGDWKRCTKQEKNLKGKGKIMHIFGTLVRLKGKGIETSYTELPLMSQPLKGYHRHRQLLAIKDV
ncbi:hypothetical protein V8E55_007448 [Tylopilus felleus]